MKYKYSDLTQTASSPDNKLSAFDRAFSYTFEFNLPLLLLPPVWRRHNYTLDDVVSSLKYYPAQILWQWALIQGILPCASAFKRNYSLPYKQQFGAKAIVTRKITSHITEHIKLSDGPSVLYHVNNYDHVPPVPIHQITDTMYSKLFVHILHPDFDALSIIDVTCIFPWKDITIIPLWLENNAIYCVRIVSMSQMLKSTRFKGSLSTRPFSIRYKGSYFAALEEGMLFTCVNPNHIKK
jgi:hypothetical protein